MPFRPDHSCARSRVRPITPALLAAYDACGNLGATSPSTLDTLTIDEPGGITGAQACAIQNVPERFTSITLENDSGVSHDAGTTTPTPALLISTSIRPNSSTARRATARQSSGTLTSVVCVT